MDIVSLLVLSAIAVNVLTSLAKAIPVAWTSRYPAYVNGALSFIAALIVLSPSFVYVDIAQTLVFAFSTAVLAGFAYNQYTSQLKRASTDEKKVLQS